MTQILSHPFNHLGRAPFRFIGMSEKVHDNGDGTTKAGSSCDHCHTGIRFECWIQDADGKTFKVGMDCADKVNNDPKLVNAVKAANLKRQRDLRAHKREQQRINRFEREKDANEAAGLGRFTNWEVRENDDLAMRLTELANFKKAARPDIAELLFDGKNGFCDQMGHRFACGDLPTSDRALTIVADILAKKTGGRKGSKKFNEAKARWAQELGL